MNNLYNRGTIYFLILSLISIAFLAFGSWFDRKLPSIIFSKIKTENYLASLKYPQYGLNYFPYIDDNIDFLIIGDSHSYAGFNFNVLSDSLKTNNFAAILAGGLRIESMSQILRLITDNPNKIPKNIIFGTRQ